MTAKTFILRTNADAEALANSILGADISKPLRVTVAVHKKKRSLAQNSLNFLWCDVIRKWLYEAGIGYKNARGETIRPYTSDEIHEFNKELFGISVAIEIGGKVAKVRRTRDMNTVDFSEFLNKVDMHWCAEGLQLPHPDDLWNEAMGE